MAEYTSLEKIRLQKIEELRAEGFDPYPTRAERTHTSAQVIAEFEAAEVSTRSTTDASVDSAPEVKATLDFSTSDSDVFIIAASDDAIESIATEIILPFVITTSVM